MPTLPPRCPSFFEADNEYPDLNCQKLAANRYLRLIYSADYRSKPFMDDDPDREGLPSPTNNLPLPTNVVTIGRRVTPALRVKILRALEVFPTKGQKGFTPEQLLIIRDYFCEPSYPQPHGEIVAAQLLSAMITSGKYELEEYPRLAEAAIKLAAILAVRFDKEVKREQETTAPKPPASEKDSLNSDSEAYDPIPF